MATIMVQGTTSDAGKSTLVAAICRSLKRRGFSVAPFKPQNMALNSAVTSEGGEIGRAQALQAQACGLAPSIHMNPVLLKPCTDVGAQVIIQGKARGNMSATSYHDYKSVAMEAVLDSHARLDEKYEVVIVEGAGSPAEINLRDRDIANMGFAEAVDCPVILVADIDRGGVFAHLVGTLELLSASEQGRVQGFVINRFRGDLSLLESGLDWLEERTQRPVLGVLPYIMDLHLDAEDALPEQKHEKHARGSFRIVVPVLPRISNHTDFDVLRLHPEIDFRFVSISDTSVAADLIILPGSKAVRDDLQSLLQNGWDHYLRRHLRYGGKVLGICGGFQILGEHVHDPLGIEGQSGSSRGLGFLACETVLAKEKTLVEREGQLSLNHEPVKGYEIHAGETSGEALGRPLITSAIGNDGAVSEDAQVAGTYWHGLFDLPTASKALLAWAGFEGHAQMPDLDAIRERELDRLCDAWEQAVDMDKFIKNFIEKSRVQI